MPELRSLSRVKIGTKVYVALGRQVIVVLARRHDGWCMYIGAVAGSDHEREWADVMITGDKLPERIARVIAEVCYGLTQDGLPYAE